MTEPGRDDTLDAVRLIRNVTGGYMVAPRHPAMAPYGKVAKRTRSYNLARPITVTSWVAYRHDTGQPLVDSNGQTLSYSTRREAVVALLASCPTDRKKD